MIEFGASPRGPIGLVQAGRVLALLRGRGHVVPDDVRDLAADVLRHRIVLSYDALSEGVTADQLLERVLAAVPEPNAEDLMRETPTRGEGAMSTARARAAGGAAGPGPAGAAADRGDRPRDHAARRADAPGRSACRRRRRRHGARAAPSVRDRRRRAPHRPRRHRPHRPAARPPARARARADDLDRARRVAVDGVRHRAPAEGRRGRGRGARVRTTRRTAGGQRRRRRVRRRRRRACCRRAAPSPGSSRCGGCSPRASRPTASSTPTRWPTRSRAWGGWRASPGSWSRSATSATSTAGSGRWRRCGSATRCSRSRSSIRAKPSSRRSGTSRWSIPRPAPASTSTPPTAACASGSPKLERERRDELARELRRLRIDHVTLATDQDWLLELGHHLR